MELNGVMGKLYYLCEWFMRLAYINLLWVVFSFLGLFFLGIFPSTAAMFTVTRKWVSGESDTPIFHTFLESYRHGFVKSNLLGAIISIIGFLIYLNFIFLQYIDGTFSRILIFPLFSVLIVFLVLLLYIFPVYTHYNLSSYQYIKYAIIIGVSHPVITLLMIIAVAIYINLILVIPGLLPFFSGSGVSIIIMWLAFSVFRKVEKSILMNSNY